MQGSVEPKVAQQDAPDTQIASPEHQCTIQFLPLKDLFEQLHTSERGLSSQEAKLRLARFGPNEPASAQHTSAIRQFLRLFLNPLVIILLLASIVSASLGDAINASIIIVMVLLGVTLNFAQTYRSQRAVERLRAEVAPTASVLRDGTWVELPRRVLVPGDSIRLAAGDLVPADARLLQAVDLHVQQAALTGESLPVEKIAGDRKPTAQNLAEAPHSVFLLSSVPPATRCVVAPAFP